MSIKFKNLVTKFLYVWVANAVGWFNEYGSMSGIVLELKRIINSPKWNTAWISLFAEAFGWYIIKNIVWNSKKT